MRPILTTYGVLLGFFLEAFFLSQCSFRNTSPGGAPIASGSSQPSRVGPEDQGKICFAYAMHNPPYFSRRGDEKSSCWVWVCPAYARLGFLKYAQQTTLGIAYPTLGIRRAPW